MSQTRSERVEIRSKLALRQNYNNIWEVYTTIHGTGIFKWFIITEAQAKWYQQTFPTIKIVKELT